MNYSHFTSLVSYSGASRLLHNFLFLHLNACSKWHYQFSCTIPSTGLSPKCCEGEGTCPSPHSDGPGVPQGTPQQGSPQKPTTDLLPAVFSPVHRLWQQSPVSALQTGMGWDSTGPAPAPGKLPAPRQTTRGAAWAAPCAAAVSAGGESTGPQAQRFSSLTAATLRTKLFLPVIGGLRRGLMLLVLAVIFGQQQLGSSQPFGVKAWGSADSGWWHQLRFACLPFFIFSVWLGQLSPIPILFLSYFVSSKP